MKVESLLLPAEVRQAKESWLKMHPAYIHLKHAIKIVLWYTQRTIEHEIIPILFAV
jgi:hypothetical protein